MNRYLLLAILAITLVGGALTHFAPPSIEWDASPNNVVITSEIWGEIDIGYIPDVQIWGDGHIVWVQYAGHGRHIKEACLAQDEVEQILGRLVNTGFFIGYRWPALEMPSFPSLYVNLKGAQHREEITRQRPALDAIYEFLRSGAGKDGTEFVPTTGQLVVFPASETDLRALQAQVRYHWQDKSFGYDLSNVRTLRPDGVVAGEELSRAWEIANDNLPLVESNGKVYYLAVIVPVISPFHRNAVPTHVCR